MSSGVHTAQRIVIVGGGIAGLSIAVRLAQSGLPVTLLESSKLGYAASTRNQGWLHSGGWFAADRTDLARMCHESLKQTLRFCPECLEPQCEPMTYLFSHPDAEISHWKESWKKAGIPFAELPVDEFCEAVPELDAKQIQHAFRLPDRAIRWKILLERLAAAAKNASAEIRTDTSAERLLVDDGCVRGVVTGSGEEIAARLVILAGNAMGASLWPDVGLSEAGGQTEYTNVPLKLHLVALKPEATRRPFCIVDANGFNHVPHLQTSVFCSDDWQVATNASDLQTEPERLEALWEHIDQFFPSLDRSKFEIVEWAGMTVQSMHADQIEPGKAPLPTIIDHKHEAPCANNLISVFTGRATLWTHVAEKTRELVLEKIGIGYSQSASPPWEMTGGL